MHVIKCPACGTEYLPKEIFIPKNFFGHNLYDIQRDESGKLFNVNSDDMDLQEIFQCEKCNKYFKVTADIRFTEDVEEKMNFDDEYAQPIKRKILFLKED